MGEAALAIDPMYAPAHLGIAKVWGYRGQAGVVSPAEANANQDGPLARALELDPQLASAHLLLAGKLVWADWDLEAGEAAFREALRLDPDDAQTQVFYGHLMMILGRPDEAVRRGELAIQLDPLDPFVTGLCGTILAFVGRFEEAIEVIQDVLAKNPGTVFGEGALSTALHLTGRHEEEVQLARARFARGNQAAVEALDRGFAEGGYTGTWEHRSGNLRDAEIAWPARQSTWHPAPAGSRMVRYPTNRQKAQRKFFCAPSFLTLDQFKGSIGVTHIVPGRVNRLGLRWLRTSNGVLPNTGNPCRPQSTRSDSGDGS